MTRLTKLVMRAAAALILLIAVRSGLPAARIPGEQSDGQARLIPAITEEALPGGATESAGASATPYSEPATDEGWQRVAPDESATPEASSASDESPGAAPSMSANPAGNESTPSAAGSPASAASMTAAATIAPTPPPPALDVSAIKSGPDLAVASLAPEIRRASSPALAASLRITEQARRQLAKGATDAALRDLNRAVEIDPGDPFEYYYLGRTYLARKNYAQALTFFRRAELGFAGRADWLGETLSFEGACQEALGQTADAAKSYKRAVEAAPGNFRAQAGYGRLAASAGPVTGLNLPAPGGEAAEAPPAEADAPPPPAESAPPPADSRE